MSKQTFLDSLQAETGLSIRRLAEITGISHSTLLRQAKDGFKADTILALSRSLDQPFLALAVGADVISREEAETISASKRRPDLADYSDEELAREMLRRAKTRKESMLNRPISEVTNLSDRRRKVTADDITEEDLRPHRDAAAYTPKEGEEPDYDSYD